MENNERDTRIDSVKFVLIVCVILGHMLDYSFRVGFNEKVHTFIYSFHMPAFILISGYLFKKKESKEFWKGIGHLAVTYCFFQILYFGGTMLYETDACGHLTGGGYKALTFSGLHNNIAKFYLPSSVLWFIVALAFWRIFTQYLPDHFLQKISLSIILSIVIAIFVSFIPLGSEFAFQRTFAFYPYFLLGYSMKRKNMLAKLYDIPLWIGVLMIAIYATIVFIVPHIPLSMLEQFHTFYDIKWIPVLLLISYFWMLPLALAVIRVIPDVSLFAKYGSQTMFFFIYHVYFVYFAHRLVYDLGWPSTFPYLLGYTFVSVVFLAILTKSRILNALVKPALFTKNADGTESPSP